MFNRQPFNLGSFNTTVSTTSLYVSGTAALTMGASVDLDAIYRAKGAANIEFGADGSVANRVIIPEGESSDMLIETTGKLTHKKKMDGQADITLTAGSAGYLTLEGEEIELASLVLEPNDELIIDTDNMTITLNGINVLGYISDASSFFTILPGTNTLTVEGGASAEVKVLWKDRWL